MIWAAGSQARRWCLLEIQSLPTLFLILIRVVITKLLEGGYERENLLLTCPIILPPYTEITTTLYPKILGQGHLSSNCLTNIRPTPPLLLSLMTTDYYFKTASAVFLILQFKTPLCLNSFEYKYSIQKRGTLLPLQLSPQGEVFGESPCHLR